MTVDLLGALEWWAQVLVANSLLASVVFAVVLLLSRVWRGRRPAVHLALWSLVLVRLVLPPGFGHPLGAGALLDRLVRVESDSRSVDRLRGYGEISYDPGGAGVSASGLNDRAAVRWPTVASTIWLAGFLLMTALRSRRLRRVRQTLADAGLVADPAVLGVCERWRLHLRIRRHVRIMTSTGGVAPFTVGVVRPVIYLPQPVLEDAACMEAAVAHEMAHVARFDALWLHLQQAVQSVYFFNPLVWIAGVRLNNAREKLCDATVVAAGGLAAREYVVGLLDVLRLELRGVAAPSMTARTRRISMRILNIIEQQGAPGPRVGTAVALAAGVGLFLLPLGRGDAESASALSTAEVEVAQAANQTPDPVDFANPLPEGRVTWEWGPGHLDPFTGEDVSHRGIDLAASAGTPVVSPADGVVTVATEAYEPSPASGTVILIDHGDGFSTFFAHLASLEVREGERIERGAVIGRVGSTGKSTGPHLHFEVRRHGEAVNPADYVRDWNR